MDIKLTACVSTLIYQSLFHANSLQKTHQSALQVQQKAEAMLQAGHYDPDAIRGCAEKVALHWQQLMLKMEDRLKLVNASVAFYKTSEQVSPTGVCSSPWWNSVFVQDLDD